MNTDLKFALYEDSLLNPLRGHKLSAMESFVASLLLSATSKKPTGIAEIIRAVEATPDLRFPGKTLKAKERAVKDTIRTLRKAHAFPIIARRKKPAGYWWCGSDEEMKEFIESASAQPLDELHTLSKMVRHNYPALSGQLKLNDSF